MNRNLIVITVEGLPTSLVGSFGSSVSDTPTLDGLAARGIVFDQCFLDSRNTNEMLVSLWSGQHAWCRQLQQTAIDLAAEINAEGRSPSLSSIWRSVTQASGSGLLVTDCHSAASLADLMGCERVELIEQSSSSEPAEDIMQCGMMALFSAAAAAIEEVAEEECQLRLCWIHSKGLKLPWDAPIELRNSFKDSDDPDPPSEVGPPLLQISDETDPDLVVGWSQVAAAQTSVLDQAIALLRSIVAEDWSWCIAGIDGSPLGEHGLIGCGQTELHDEQLQVATIVCPYPAPTIGWRVAEICQLPDLAVTIAELCGLQLSGSWGISQLGEPEDASPTQWDAQHQVAVLSEVERVWVRTPAWSCTLEQSGAHKLYVKPDDRWETSEISIRCQDVIEQLQQLVEKFRLVAEGKNRIGLTKLSELMCNLHR